MEIKPENLTDIDILYLYLEYDIGNYTNCYDDPNDGLVWIQVMMYADGTILYDSGDRDPYPPADGDRCYYIENIPKKISVDDFITMYGDEEKIKHMLAKHKEKLKVYDSLPVLNFALPERFRTSRPSSYPNRIKTYNFSRLNAKGTKEVYFFGYDVCRSMSKSGKTKFYDFVCGSVYKASNLEEEEKQ